MNNGLRVAAVVVTYNRLPLLQQCLAALKAQTVPPAAVWVIDNASTDGTREAVTWAGPAASPAACSRRPRQGMTPCG